MRPQIPPVSLVPLRPLRPPLRDSAFLSGEIQSAAGLVVIDEDRLALVDFAFQKAASERGFDLTLDRAFQRSGAVIRIEAGLRQMRARRVGQLQIDVAFGQAPPEPVELYLDDLFQMLFGQRMEDDDLVHAVEEFGAEM